MLQDTRSKLQEAETRIRSLREDRARARKLADQAKAAAESAPSGKGGDAAVDTAVTAAKNVKAIDAQIEQVSEEQTRLLRTLGDAEAGRAGFAWAGVDGWGELARQIDPPSVTRADVAAGALLAQTEPGTGSYPGTPASTAIPPARAVAPIRQPLYSVFPQSPVPTPADLAVTDFTVDFGQSELTGGERAPAATTEKAELEATVAGATPALRQFAAVINGLPDKVFSNQQAVQALLREEMTRLLDLAIDQHLVAKVEASSPPSGSSGTTWIERIRNAVRDHRALGSRPSVLAVSPDVGAELDLSQTGSDNMFVFPLRDSGSSSPLWSLAVVESRAVDDPILFDPGRCAVVYAGQGWLLADPYSGLSRNVIRLRCELEAVAHVRVATGAYLLA